MIPSIAALFGIDIWEYVSMIGAVSTLVVTMLFFMIPDFLIPLNFSSKEMFEFDFKTEISRNKKHREKIHKVNPLYWRILSYFEKEKPFLDFDFSLRHLERELGISGRYLSEAIKEQTGMNFPAFVNQARLDYYTEYLCKVSDSANKTVEAVAIELGFRSVNSFYQVVRKMKGCTLKEFLNSGSNIASYDSVS